jgi:uncharacterized protein YbjQ (UPF0145 family)
LVVEAGANVAPRSSSTPSGPSVASAGDGGPAEDVPAEATVDEAPADEVPAELELEELPPQPVRTNPKTSARKIPSFIAGERYSLRLEVGADSFTRRMSESAAGAPQGLPMTTALELPGMRIKENLGVCYGLVVRSMGFVGGVSASFKALRRGEISQYTQLLEDSRRHAIDRMVDNARLLGAEAIIAVRSDSSEIGQQFTEIVAYGTAVTLGAGA